VWPLPSCSGFFGALIAIYSVEENKALEHIWYLYFVSLPHSRWNGSFSLLFEAYGIALPSFSQNQ
jgi:hypothetical protein